MKPSMITVNALNSKFFVVLETLIEVTVNVSILRKYGQHSPFLYNTANYRIKEQLINVCKTE